MEFVLGALTYPQIGKIIYTSGQGNTQKAISDFRSLIAQGVDVIIGFPDAGAAMLPSYRGAMQKGIVVVPYTSTPGGTAGKDLDGVRLRGSLPARQELRRRHEHAGQERQGRLPRRHAGQRPVARVGRPAKSRRSNKSIQVVGTADTNWTRQGSLQAMSGFLSKYPDLKGVSYEYADGFIGGVQAYQAAKKPINLVLTLRTDEMGLFCQWKKINNPNFKIYYSNGGNFQSRLALTAAMMKLNGGEHSARP